MLKSRQFYIRQYSFKTLSWKLWKGEIEVLLIRFPMFTVPMLWPLLHNYRFYMALKVLLSIIWYNWDYNRHVASDINIKKTYQIRVLSSWKGGDLQRCVIQWRFGSSMEFFFFKMAACWYYCIVGQVMWCHLCCPLSTGWWHY